MSEHLNQEVVLDIESGDPITWRQVATVPDTATVTAGRLVVRTMVGSASALVDLAGTNITGPTNAADGEHDFAVDFLLTREHTRAIGNHLRVWAATVTYGNEERTFASGTVRCRIDEITS